MSQYSHKNKSFQTIFGKIVLLAFLLMLAALLALGGQIAKAAPVQASVTAPLYRKGPVHVLKAPLSAMAGKEEAILDWRTQNFTMNFDLPAHNFYEKLDLFLSVYPTGEVKKGTPIEISFNGGEPIPVYGQGSAFDAHISLDTSRIQLSGNTLIISYETPNGQKCLSRNNGQWIVDLGRSKLVATSRAKQRNMQIVEVERRLAHPMAAPHRVSILARGQNKTAYETLAAQAIGVRMKSVPEFKLTGGPTDMKIIIGTPSQIAPLVANTSLLSEKGAVVFLDQGRIPILVLSAPHEEQVLALVQAFAQHHLPAVRRTAISGFEFKSQPALQARKILNTGSYKMTEIGNPVLTTSWRPDATKIKFNITNPSQTTGNMTLKILSAKDINPKSRLSVSLNGQSLGYTRLNKPTKIVEFPIKAGLLKPTGNVMRLTPHIEPDAQDTSCEAMAYIPTVLISGKSKIHLKSTGLVKSHDRNSHDLRNFAASGAPFNKDATIVLPARGRKDKQAVLKFLAQSAQTFGPVWTNATYVTALPDENARTANLLVIAPQNAISPAFLETAPKAVLAKGRISGGIAALYPSPYQNGRIIGLITANTRGGFASALADMNNRDKWNRLSGSVSHWNHKDVLMAQTALMAKAANAPATAKTAPIKTGGLASFINRSKTALGSMRLPAFGQHSPKSPQPVKIASTAKTMPLSAGQAVQHKILFLRGPIPVSAFMEKKSILSDMTDWFAKMKASHRLKASYRPLKAKTRINLEDMPKLELKKPKLKPLQISGANKLRVSTGRHIMAVQSWWKNDILRGRIGHKTTKWWKSVLHNPRVFFGLLVFLVFLLTAFLSPMRTKALEKTRKRPGSKYF